MRCANIAEQMIAYMMTRVGHTLSTHLSVMSLTRWCTLKDAADVMCGVGYEIRRCCSVFRSIGTVPDAVVHVRGLFLMLLCMYGRLHETFPPRACEPDAYNTGMLR